MHVSSHTCSPSHALLSRFLSVLCALAHCSPEASMTTSRRVPLLRSMNPDLQSTADQALYGYTCWLHSQPLDPDPTTKRKHHCHLVPHVSITLSTLYHTQASHSHLCAPMFAPCRTRPPPVSPPTSPAAARPWTQRTTRRCCWSTASAPSGPSISGWTSGAWTSPSPAARRRSACQQGSPSWQPATRWVTVIMGFASVHFCSFSERKLSY